MSTYPRFALFLVCAFGCMPAGDAADDTAGTDAEQGTSTSNGPEAAPSTSEAPTTGSLVETTTNGSTTDAGEPPEAPTLSLGFSAVKSFDFTWTASPGATGYQLLEQSDDAAGEVALAVDFPGTSLSLPMPLHLRGGASYVVRACNDAGCSDSEVVPVSSAMTAAIGYVKASNSASSAQFGAGAAISADGSTIVVGAPLESGCSVNIDGEQSGAVCPSAGAAHVFVQSGQTWVRQAYLKPSRIGNGDLFGEAVAISGDGNIVAIGAREESSSVVGVDGKAGDGKAPRSGAVYVFVRKGGSWTQEAYLKASNTGADDQFGASVTLSSSGDTLAVGAPGEASAATGVGGPQNDDSAYAAGAVYVYSSMDGVWAQRAYLKASNSDEKDYFGYSCALAGGGRTLVVGAVGEASAAAGNDGEPDKNAAPWSGAAYVFTATGDVWSQQAHLKASNSDGGDFFGHSVAISSDSTTVAVSAIYESSRATAIDGDESDDGAAEAGAVYVFSWTGQAWMKQAYVKAPNAEEYDNFGTRVTLSHDGSILGVSASFEDGADVGVDGDLSGNGRSDSGAAYVYQRDRSVWRHRSYVKAPNADAEDRFGSALAVSGDGRTLVVGAPQEASLAQGIGGAQGDNLGSNVGAVYVY